MRTSGPKRSDELRVRDRAGETTSLLRGSPAELVPPGIMEDGLGDMKGEASRLSEESRGLVKERSGDADLSGLLSFVDAGVVIIFACFPRTLVIFFLFCAFNNDIAHGDPHLLGL